MKVLFICYPHGPAEKAGYDHQILSIAEGLIELGIKPYATIDFWKKSLSVGDYLIKKSENVEMHEFDVVVFSSHIFIYNRLDLLPPGLLTDQRKYKLVFLDSFFGIITPGFKKSMRSVDFVLKSHFSTKYNYPENFIPWQFGLTNRIINYVDPLPFDDRDNSTLSNFRVRHTVRDYVERKVMNLFYDDYPKNLTTESLVKSNMTELDLLFWTQTGKRHYPSYYKRLGKSKIVNATGGYFQSSISNSKNPVNKFLGKLERRVQIFPYDRICQFDSWRFWEALASGCCTLHIDFEKYGAKLPIMPKNGSHYLGIDLDNYRNIKDVLSSKDGIKNIAQRGREWALKYYSPRAIAERFINLIQ